MSSTPTQDAIIQLILRYIGGSKLQAANKLQVAGQKVAVQASSLTSIANQIAATGGATIEQVRQTMLQNPKAIAVAAIKKNIGALEARIGINA